MDQDARSAVVSAASEVLGDRGGARPRKHSTPVAPHATRAGAPAAPIFHFSAAARGPAPFISPRQQQPPLPSSGAVPVVGQSGFRRPPCHTAVTIHDAVPPSSTSQPPSSDNGSSGSGAALPLRSRAPPLSVDTSPGPHRNHHPIAAPPAGLGNVNEASPVRASRRRTTSNGAIASSMQPGGSRSPLKKTTPTTKPSLVPPPAAPVLSSVFVRRKPLQRSPSPSHELAHAHGLHAPQVYFFQDADSDTSSQRPHGQHDGDTHDDGSTGETTDSSQGSTADDSANRNLPGETRASNRRGSKSPKHRRQRTASLFHQSQHVLGIEKLGELSREEEAYDFAILLKPSKIEEHLEIVTARPDVDPIINNEGPEGQRGSTTVPNAPSLIRVGSQVQSQATSAGPADDAGHVAETTPTVAFQLPGTPRSQLRRQKHDPVNARVLLVQRITRTGLQVKRLLSLDGRQTLLKVRAPQAVLEMGAERLRLRKRRKFDQIWMEFACELRETFLDFDATRGGVQFLDSEKQSIVHALLTSDASAGGAGLNEFCPLKSKHVLKMFPLHKHDELVALRTHWVTYWRGGSNSTGGNDDDTESCLRTCGARTKRLATHALSQPIDDIAQYYGERIAFYFAWLEMYTRWLVVPSIAGALLFVLQVRAKTLDHPLASVYAIFMALWTSAFLLAWKRRAATLAYKWGTLGYEEAECTRPEFYGDPALSTATHKVYPAWKRYAKYGVTVPLVTTSIALVLVLTFYAFITRDRLEAQSIAVKAQAANLAKDIARDLQHGLTLANFKRLTALGLDWDFWFYFLITPILYGLLIPVLDYAFTKVARRLTNWENHQTESHYQSHLILKVFSFRFVHVFASLYYYAFNPSTSGGGSSLLRLAVQLASFMVSDQLWRNVMQTLYPFVQRRMQAQRKKQATNTQFHQSTVFNSLSGGERRTGGRRGPRHGSQLAYAHTPLTSNAVIHEQCVRLEQASDHAWEEAELEPYDTFEDYTEMLIQFGYVTFFSLAFPLAPLLALVNNLFEIRMDAFKLCHAKQRPLAQKASGIGVWFHVLQLMSVLAVLTNCLHIAFTTTLVERLFPSVSSAHKLWVVFGVEHAILALKVWMMVVVPSTPNAVKLEVRKEREHAKIESARAMAAKIQSQQLQLARQQEAEQDAALKKAESADPVVDDHDAVARGSAIRRRSRGASGSTGSGTHEDSLRAAQAVLQDV